MQTTLNLLKVLGVLIATITTVIVIVFGFWVIWVLIFITEATSVPNNFDMDQNETLQFMAAFTRSLAFNHTENIRTYVDPSKWDLISRWETEHVALAASPDDCSYPDSDIQPSMSSYGDKFNYFLPLRCKGKLTFLDVYGARLKLQNDGKWMIMDLDKICQNTGEVDEQCWK